MEIDRQKIWLGFLKAISYIVNAAIVLAIVAFVAWYIMGLFKAGSAPVHFTRPH